MNGLYIHIPFCEKKCAYCDFASFSGRLSAVKVYIDAVIKEAQKYEGVSVSTVFIGGGTPSCIPDGEIYRLVRGIKNNIDFSGVTEFSAEANPNSLTYDKACEYRETGINRISIGLQSSSPRLLKLLGRLHTPEQFSSAVGYAEKAGITNINADIMYSLPYQTKDDIYETLSFLSQHTLTHISAYSLILEEGTPLYDSHPVLPDEDIDREMFYIIKNELSKPGFHRYEISNFALDGYECAHNLIYWRVNDYIGLGSAAHSCFKGMRYYNPPDIDEYISGKTHLGEQPQDITAEKIMLGLRLKEGIDACLLPSSDEMSRLLKRMEAHGLCRLSERLVLTDAGMDIQNEILAEIFKLFPS